jgi:hypothetical protein
METFRVSGTYIYEDTGNPRKDRLIYKVLDNGEVESGPGLGYEHDTLTNAVPAYMVDEAIENWRIEKGIR